MVWFIFVLNALAVHRITVLVTEDKITEPFRDRLYRRWNPSESWTYLFTCPWCVSIWAAAFAVAATLIFPVLWLPLAAVLALSSITGLIESKR